MKSLVLKLPNIAHIINNNGRTVVILSNFSKVLPTKVLRTLLVKLTCCGTSGNVHTCIQNIGWDRIRGGWIISGLTQGPMLGDLFATIYY